MLGIAWVVGPELATLAVALEGREGQVLRRTLPLALGYALLVGIAAFVVRGR